MPNKKDFIFWLHPEFPSAGWYHLQLPTGFFTTSQKISFFLCLIPSVRLETALVTATGGFDFKSSAIRFASWVIKVRKFLAMILTKIVGAMKDYEKANKEKQESCQKKAFEQFLAYLYLENADKQSMDRSLPVWIPNNLWAMISIQSQPRSRIMSLVITSLITHQSLGVARGNTGDKSPPFWRHSRHIGSHLVNQNFVFIHFGFQNGFFPI